MTPEEAAEQARARWGSRAAVGIYQCWQCVDDGVLEDSTCYVGVVHPEHSNLDVRGRGQTFEEAFAHADR